MRLFQRIIWQAKKLYKGIQKGKTKASSVGKVS